MLLNYFYFEDNRMEKSLRISSSFMTVGPGHECLNLHHTQRTEHNAQTREQ